MRYPGRMIVAVTCFLLVLSQRLMAQSAGMPSQEDIQKILRQRIDVEHQSVGIVVGVIDAQGQRVVGYGALRDKDPQVPDGETLFEIGSVTKVLTSLLLADELQRGEIALADPVSKYLPKTVTLPTFKQSEITLLDLATHKSGLPTLPSNLKPQDPLNPYADYTVEQMYEYLSNAKLTRAPGEKYEYSNLATGLLGHILAQRAGTDYETLVVTRICKPLGMTSTLMKLTPEARKRLASGHDKTLSETGNWDIPTLAGAGAIRSTVNDMLKFVAANLGKEPTPLTAAIEEQLKTRQPTGVSDVGIALGWHTLTKFDHEIFWHNGETGGYHSFVGFDKKRGLGVVVLSNCSIDIDDLGRHLLDQNYPLKKVQPLKRRVAIQVEPKVLETYVGDYELIPTFVISITQQEQRLMLQATGQPKFELFAETPKKFFLKVVDAQVTFVSDDKGVVTKLILHQNGLDLPGVKRKK